MKSIYIFTSNDCFHCASLKKEMDEAGISFHDIEVNLNPQIWNSVVKQTKEKIVPTVFIKKEDDGHGIIYVPGRDFQTNAEIIQIIKDNI